MATKCCPLTKLRNSYPRGVAATWGEKSMGTATLKQGKHLLKLAEGVPLEQLVALCDSGLLSDLFCANVPSIDRTKFREVCGFKPQVRAKYNQSSYSSLLEKLIGEHDAHFGKIDEDINPQNFPVQPIRGEYKLFSNEYGLGLEDIVRDMFSARCLPANIYELLSWEGWNKKDLVFSLGSMCVSEGYMKVPFIFRMGQGVPAELRLEYLILKEPPSKGAYFLGVCCL